jgi:hypothetical protein
VSRRKNKKPTASIDSEDSNASQKAKDNKDNSMETKATQKETSAEQQIKKEPITPAEATDLGALPWNAPQLRSQTSREHWTTNRTGERDIYYIGDSHLRVFLKMDWNRRNRHGEGFPGACLRHLSPHPRITVDHDLFRLECPPEDSPDYRVIINMLGGNDVQSKRYHQTNDNIEKQDLAKQKGEKLEMQTSAEFEVITARTIIQKMKRATQKLRRKFPNSHLVQLSIQPRQESDGRSTIRSVQCITEEIKRERAFCNSLFNLGDKKVHYLEIQGVWESYGKLRKELYNDKGELIHMSTQGNNCLDSLYSQIETFVTDSNLNRQDIPTKTLSGICHNGRITLYNSHSPPDKK